MSEPNTGFRSPNLLQSAIPLIVLIGFLTLNVLFFRDDTLSGANQMALLLSAGVCSLLALRLGFRWNDLFDGMLNSIGAAMPAMLILLLIGSLAGTWLLSGVVPTLIYYGLLVLHPSIFLFAACIICSLVSVATGSSWSTVATLGIALLGIGKALGIHEGIIAGAIISGAYFGDKISPLSDTTNLAPAMAGTDVFTHVKYLLYTTVPSIVITLIILLIWGFTLQSKDTSLDVQNVMEAIKGTFQITPWLLLVPALTIAVILLKTPAIPALMFATLLGAAFALIFQPDIIKQVGEHEGGWGINAYMACFKAMFGPIQIETGQPEVNELLATKGMAGMLNTIWLIISAMIFGGAMEVTGMLKRLIRIIIDRAKSTVALVSSTAATCIFFNITASDQYMAIVVPGRMFAPVYRQRGLKPEVLSRTLEDSGTVTSVLIPWNTCGATQSAVLGVSTWIYFPYAFFCLISPLMTMLFAWLNIRIRRLSPEEMAEPAKTSIAEKKD
ncbi:MAG: Na+/H+ antiporter NhaC [Bacteroidales bacterium]|nr:Na+/H+ antiporter NhaC [Bacteroidales bacterium]